MSFEPAPGSTGGLSPSPLAGGKRKGKMTPWLQHVMAVKKPGMSLGDAMKEAKKTYKKQSGGSNCGSGMEGGMLAGMMGPMGGRRGATKKRSRRGGSLYGFGGGNGGGNDGGLADGAAAYGGNTDMTWHAPGGSSLTGSGPVAPAKGGRRSRSRRHRRRGSSKTAKAHGKRRR